MTVPPAISPDTPLFRSVLGPDWHALGPVVRRHYALRPFSEDAITVRGVMHAVEHGAAAGLLLPLARIFGALVPYRGTGVPVEVHYTARRDSAQIHWDRVFHFEARPPYHFRSHMEPDGAGRVIEFVRFGVGLRLRVTAEDGALVFRDDGALWRLFGIDVPLPLSLLLGRTYVEERPIDESSFSMRMSLRHPLLGDVFGYAGRFEL